MSTLDASAPHDSDEIERLLIARQKSDALEMLDFARKRAIKLPYDLILMLTVEKFERGAADREYANFIGALGKLTELIAPATPESIRFARDVNAKGISKLRKLINLYAGVGYLLFALLFVCQGYWFLLNSVVENITATTLALTPYAEAEDVVKHQLETKIGRTATDDEREAEMLKIYDRVGEQVLAQQGIRGYSEYKSNEKLLSGNERNFLDITLVSDYAGLNSFAGWLAPLLGDQRSVDLVGDRYYLYFLGLPELRRMQAAHMILDMLNRYVLPIIYGFLGAAIYLVRRLSSEIKRVSFTESMRPELVTRFFLGGVSGLVVAWFVAPDSPKAESLLHNTSVLSTLSPLALSFVAGYAIELVFSAIDRIVSAFTDTEYKARG